MRTRKIWNMKTNFWLKFWLLNSSTNMRHLWVLNFYDKIFCRITNTLKYFFKVVFLFHSFLDLTVSKMWLGWEDEINKRDGVCRDLNGEHQSKQENIFKKTWTDVNSIFEFLYLCNRLVYTFDISNLDYLI